MGGESELKISLGGDGGKETFLSDPWDEPHQG